MAEYAELIKALRICSSELNCGDCPLLYRDSCSSDELMNDAAAAIEALQAEVEELKRVNMELFDDLPKYGDKILHLVSVEDEPPEPNIQCLVRDDDNNYAVGYYRQDVKAWDSPFFGWLERDDEYYEDGDLCRIGKVVAWMPLPEPPQDK